MNPYANDVQVCAYWNYGEKPLSHVRQALVDRAYAKHSAYVSFIDDDDMVPGYYVTYVRDRLVHAPDYVGWRMQCYWNKKPLKPTYHSLRYDKWWEDDKGYYRDISHLNPIRTSLAVQADFRKTNPPEDVGWADQLRGKVKTERYIDDIMYLYQYTPGDSMWRPGSVKPGPRPEPPEVTHTYFSWHPGSSM